MSFDAMDIYYIKVFVSPILIFFFCLITMKVCWRCYCRGSVTYDEEQPRAPIYVIPISFNEAESNDSDYSDSESSMDSYAPPSYDTLELPPPYSELKQNIPDEAPPAYSRLEIPAGPAEHFGFLPSEQTFCSNE